MKKFSKSKTSIGKIQPRRPITGQRDIKISKKSISPNNRTQKLQNSHIDIKKQLSLEKTNKNKISKEKVKNIKRLKPNKTEKEILSEKDKALLSAAQKTNKDFIKVFVRFRPLNDLENGLLSDNCGWTIPKHISNTEIGIFSSKELKEKNGPVPANLTFKYDKIFNMD